MGFGLATFLVIATILVAVFLVGHLNQRSTAEIVDWKPTRSPEVEAENEIEDLRQMVDAQNERRRSRGAPDLDEDKLRAEVEEEELDKLRRGDPFGGM